MAKKIMHITEIAQRIGRTPATVRAQMKKGNLGKVERVAPGKYLVNPHDLKLYLEKARAARKGPKLGTRDTKNFFYVRKFTQEEARERAEKLLEAYKARHPEKFEGDPEAAEDLEIKKFEHFYNLAMVAYKEIPKEQPLSKIQSRRLEDLPFDVFTKLQNEYSIEDAYFFAVQFNLWLERGYDFQDPVKRNLILGIIDDTIREERLRRKIRMIKDYVDIDLENALERASRRISDNYASLGEIHRRGQRSDEAKESGTPKESSRSKQRRDFHDIG